jgi:hypothetical protein
VTGFPFGFFAGQGENSQEYIRLSRVFNDDPAKKTPERQLRWVFEGTLWPVGNLFSGNFALAPEAA